MRFPNVLIPLLFFGEGWLAGLILYTIVPLPVPGWVVTNGLGLIVCAGLTFSMKQKLLGVHQRQERLVPTTVEGHAGLDRAALEALTASFIALGFEPQINYTIERTPPSPMDGFARLLYHPVSHTIVEINQVMVNGVPATTMAPTFFTIFEDDWSFTTMNRPPGRNVAVIYALRRPKRLWQILPNDSPAAAYEGHLKGLTSIAQRFQLKPIEKDPVDAYIANQERSKAERYETARRRNIIAFLWDVDRYTWAPVMSWMG